MSARIIKLNVGTSNVLAQRPTVVGVSFLALVCGAFGWLAVSEALDGKWGLLLLMGGLLPCLLRVVPLIRTTAYLDGQWLVFRARQRFVHDLATADVRLDRRPAMDRRLTSSSVWYGARPGVRYQVVDVPAGELPALFLRPAAGPEWYVVPLHNVEGRISPAHQLEAIAGMIAAYRPGDRAAAEAVAAPRQLADDHNPHRRTGPR